MALHHCMESPGGKRGVMTWQAKVMQTSQGFRVISSPCIHAVSRTLNQSIVDRRGLKAPAQLEIQHLSIGLMGL